MRHIKGYAVALTIVLSVLFSQCTQPDGYIGNWFGSWHLESMLVNGEEDKSYEKNIILSFQGNVFQFIYLQKAELFGSWSYAGETLTLIAGYQDPIPAYFDPFPVTMYFPKGIEELEITVTKLESKTMQWQYISPEGDLITYNFKKYP